MTRRPSKRVREEAAMICQLSASSGRGQHDSAAALGISEKSASYELAGQAFNAVADDNPNRQCRWETGGTWETQMAEAEAMLRCGWSP